MNYPAVILCALFAVACFVDAHYEDCGSTVGELKEVKISGCDDSMQTCNLVRNTNATIQITFRTKKPIPKVEAVVHGIILDVPMPFPLKNPNACTDPKSNIQCPLAEGTEQIYKEELQVLKNYPKMSLKVKWELQDENKEDIVCIMISAKIV